MSDLARENNEWFFLLERFPELILNEKTCVDMPLFICPEDQDYNVLEVLTFFKEHDAYHMDYLKFLSITDWSDVLEVVYHLFSYRTQKRCLVSKRISREGPRLHSCSHIWPAANWHEREMFDLFGVVFDGHPDLKRILLPDDWQGHPLRKDYTQNQTYNGVSTSRTYLTQLPSFSEDISTKTPLTKG